MLPLRTPEFACSFIALLLTLAACGPGDTIDEAAAEAAADSKAAAEAKAEVAVEEKMFDESVSDDKCALLTPADVASATGVPEAALEQRTLGSSCLYSWESGDGWQDGSIYFGSLRVRESIEDAKRRYARKTRDLTAGDVSDAKEQLDEELDEKANDGEMTESEAATASSLAAAMPETDFTHTALDGIGNEAAMDNMGSVYIRYGNAVISFSGKTAGEDHLDPERAAAIAQAIVGHLDSM